MRHTLAIIAALLSTTAISCGTEIGDPCTLSRDCSPRGDRFCDTTSPSGYCTVIGCNYNNCPDESVCIRFFALAITNIPCDPTTENITTNDCTADELCTLSGNCMPRSAEFRFCMATCESRSDCRDSYECRNEELMKQHGGEPVSEPGTSAGNSSTAFCAPEPFL